VTCARPGSSQANAGKSCTCAGADSPHFAEIKRVAGVLERRYPDCRVIEEGQLRHEERIHGGPIASAMLSSDQGRGPTLHRPDLVIWPPAGEPGLPVAVEVELSLKTGKYLSRICRAWKRCPLVDCVLYVASSKVERPLRRTIAAADARERVLVIALDALARELESAETVVGRATT
jgi:hypothetical protein